MFSARILIYLYSDISPHYVVERILAQFMSQIRILEFIVCSIIFPAIEAILL